MARKRVEAESTDGSVDANTTTSLVRAKDGSAFAKWYLLAFPSPPPFCMLLIPSFSYPCLEILKKYTNLFLANSVFLL